jgi:pentatricopeptide repeat protein
MQSLDVTNRALALLQASSVSLTLELANSLITAYAQLGKLQKALGVFDDMKAAGIAPDARSFVTLITCAANMNSFATVDTVRDMIHEHKIPLSTDLGNSIVAAHCRAAAKDREMFSAGHISEAESVILLMEKAGITRRRTYAPLLALFESKGLTGRAADLRASMRRNHQRNRKGEEAEEGEGEEGQGEESNKS